MKTFLARAALVLISAPAHAFEALVLRCNDGDTCTVDTAQGTLKIRLAEIDAPEIYQSYGPEAQVVICGMICDRVVDIEPRGTSYDRVVGLIRVQGADTSEAMVRSGLGLPAVRSRSSDTGTSGRGQTGGQGPLGRSARDPTLGVAPRRILDHGHDHAHGADQLLAVALATG